MKTCATRFFFTLAAVLFAAATAFAASSLEVDPNAKPYKWKIAKTNHRDYGDFGISEDFLCYIPLSATNNEARLRATVLDIKKHVLKGQDTIRIFLYLAGPLKLDFGEYVQFGWSRQLGDDYFVVNENHIFRTSIYPEMKEEFEKERARWNAEKERLKAEHGEITHIIP